MAKVGGIEKGFASYGAKLVNRNWAVSSLIDGAVVMSLWAHRFKGGVYSDRLSRWSGLGNALFRKHLEQAVADDLPVRVVIATSQNPEAAERGEDMSKYKNTFAIRPEWIAQIEHFDGDEFSIRFRQV